MLMSDLKFVFDSVLLFTELCTLNIQNNWSFAEMPASFSAKERKREK